MDSSCRTEKGVRGRKRKIKNRKENKSQTKMRGILKHCNLFMVQERNRRHSCDPGGMDGGVREDRFIPLTSQLRFKMQPTFSSLKEKRIKLSFKSLDRIIGVHRPLDAPPTVH